MKRKLATVLGFLILPLLYAFANDPLGWQSVLIPRFSQRTVNAVQVLDQNTIVMAGGHETNDSIRSVFVSSDGGQSWSLVMDTVGESWLTSLDFVNTSVGFASGYDGAVLKTTTGGFSWSQQNVPSNVAHRHFNSVFFINDQTGFIAGGQRANDSIQTILKTTDGGNTWNILRDVPGHWLKSIFFADVNNGYAVGEQGVVLRTTDGGNNWSQLSLPGNTAQRNFNTVFFLDANTGFIGGGNRSLDSIQTILKTTDGGDNWSIISDHVSPWIRSIYFTSSINGFAVGDKGTVLHSNDTGDTWTQIAIPDTTNDTIRGLFAVHFLNSDFGVASGQIGKTLIYQSPIPTAPLTVTGYATEITPVSAILNGTANANGIITDVSFEYGTTITLGFSVTANPATVTGNVAVPVSVEISGLDSNTVYYYRIKATNGNGTSLGVIRQFFAGRNPVPNWDFEAWQSLSDFVPAQWITLGVSRQVTSHDGSFAVDLIQRGEEIPAGGVLFGLPGENGLVGGIPFAARPDSLIGYFRYDIAANDSALILLYLKKNGVFNSQQSYYIAGNSNGIFQRLSFPITYSNTEIPDSIILGITNTDFFSSPDTSSRVSIDNISFAGTTVNVPNADFEDWITYTGEKVISWTAAGAESPLGWFTPPVTKTTDKQHGNYAARIANILELNGTVGRLEAGNKRNNNGPAFPMYDRPSEFHFWLKYFPENGDSAMVGLNLFKNGQPVAGVQFFLDTVVSSYTLFSFPIIYQTLADSPDSASLMIESGRKLDDTPPRGESVLYIDNIGLDGFYKGEFAANAGSDTSICEGATVTIGGNPTGAGGTLPYTYAWSPGGTLSSTDSPNPLAAPASSTTYHVTVTDDNGNSVTDEVVITVDICGGISEWHSPNNLVAVYPNPANGEFHIKLSGGKEETVTVALLDLSGKEIQKSKAQCSTAPCELVLNAEKIPNGCYLVTVLRQGSRQHGKLVIYR